MEGNELILRIFYREPETDKVLNIIGVVDEVQLNSNDNNFILVKNYGDKIIGKDCIIDFKFCEEVDDNLFELWQQNRLSSSRVKAEA
jgi:hypothetical protein